MVNRQLYIDKIKPFINRDVVKVLTGIRRSGKSILLELIKNELQNMGIPKTHFLSINFETLGESFVKSVDLTYSHIKQFFENATKQTKKRHVNSHAKRWAPFRSKQKIYLFLDEIQELNGWEKLVNSLLADFNADIYITGSNAKMLSGELATYLGGRYVEFSIYPFSFSEVKLASKANQISETSFEKYIELGGMPFLHKQPTDDFSAKQYLKDIYNSIILKDIVERYGIRDAELLERLLIYFVANVGHSFSVGNLIKFLKNEKRNLSNETIYNYINYAKSAMLIHLISREDILGKQILSFQEKLYITDNGIREAIYGNNFRDIDQILENIVLIELLRRDFKVTVGKIKDREIDFVAKKGAEKIYIQVCYLLASKETIEREFSPLESIPDNYPKFVLSMDKISRSRNGIKHLNIEKFLCSTNL